MTTGIFIRILYQSRFLFFVPYETYNKASIF